MQFHDYNEMIDFTESMQGFLSRDCIIKLEEVLIKMSPNNVDLNIFKKRGKNFKALMKEYNDILISELEDKINQLLS